MSDREVCARGTLNGRPTEIVRYDRAGKFYAEWEGLDESGRQRQQIDLNEAIERVKIIVSDGGQHFAGAARRLDRGLGLVTAPKPYTIYRIPSPGVDTYVRTMSPAGLVDDDGMVTVHPADGLGTIGEPHHTVNGRPAITLHTTTRMRHTSLVEHCADDQWETDDQWAERVQREAEERHAAPGYDHDAAVTACRADLQAEIDAITGPAEGAFSDVRQRAIIDHGGQQQL